MSKASDDKIRRWIPAIEKIRSDLGLTAQQYPTWVVLSLINIESNGNPDAHSIRKGKPSQFYGLLQIGRAASADVGRRNTDHDGDGELAIDSFLRYAEKYARGPTRHNYEPEKISILWKSGPGTVKEYNRLQKTRGQAEAEAYLSQLWGGSSLVYLNKFRKYAKKWSDGKAQLADPALVLPVSNRRQYNAPSATGLPDCPPTAPAADIANPSRDLAQATVRTALEAIAITQQGGATGFKTDLVDPNVEAGAQIRSIRVLRGDRFETLSAVFPASVESVNYSLPLVGPSLAKGFGVPLGPPGEYTHGVEYDTSGDPRQTVHAVARGTVANVLVTEERGNVLVINHEGFLVSEYGHLSEVLVAVGDEVLPGDLVARAGQTLGKLNESTNQVEAVARARRDPVLYFELRGDTNLFSSGVASAAADFGSRPLPIDPNAILLTAPQPGEVRAVSRVESALIDEVRTSFAELAMTASTPNAQVASESAYDFSTAMSRADAMASLTRADYSSHEDTQRITRSVFGGAAFALNGTEF